MTWRRRPDVARLAACALDGSRVVAATAMMLLPTILSAAAILSGATPSATRFAHHLDLLHGSDATDVFVGGERLVIVTKVPVVNGLPERFAVT